MNTPEQEGPEPHSDAPSDYEPAVKTKHLPIIMAFSLAFLFFFGSLLMGPASDSNREAIGLFAVAGSGFAIASSLALIAAGFFLYVNKLNQ